MPGSRKDFRTLVRRLRFSDADRSERNQHIAARIFGESKTIQGPDFRAISGADLRCIFDLYDQQYFDRRLNLALNDTPLEFRVSSRMTRAGGKTGFWKKNRNSPIERLEIAVSSTLLFQTFRGEQTDHSIRVTGVECYTRLDALMRVMEHELVHLAELLGWDESSCRRDRFQTIAWQVFGHTDHRHALITPRDRAAAAGVRPGRQVRFDFRGETLNGIVNRVTRRATVLVPASDGELFSDGITYRRYYVPIRMLEPVKDNG